MNFKRICMGLISLVLVACLLVNVSPIKAEATSAAIAAIPVAVPGVAVIGACLVGLGVLVGVATTDWDNVVDNAVEYYKEQGVIGADGNMDIYSLTNAGYQYGVAEGMLSGLKDWLFENEVLTETSVTVPSGKWIYNGISFPILPDWNKETHPYAFITQYGSNDVEFHAVSSFSSQYLNGNVYFSLGDHVCSKLLSSGTMWGDIVKDAATGYILSENRYLYWSNFDIYHPDGTLILAASEPSSTQTVTAEDYLTLNYVAPSEMDFSTGYSTWTAGAISVPGVRAEEGEETVVVPLSIPGTAADVYSFSQADVWTGANTAADVIAQAVPITGTGTADPTLPVVPDVPTEIAPYTFSLNDIFPFCIPFDLYDFLTCLDAAPVAPVIEWALQLPGGGTFPITLDLSPFDSVAQLLRRLELLIFCVGLALKTRDLIKG